MRGELPELTKYSAGDWQLTDMQHSYHRDKMHRAFVDAGYESVEDIEVGVGEAFRKTAAPKMAIGALLCSLPGLVIGGLFGFDDTPAQVGGIDRAWVHVDKGGLTATYHIENSLTVHSFFYHNEGLLGLEDQPYGRPMGTVKQIFEWMEPIPYPGVVGGFA